MTKKNEEKKILINPNVWNYGDYLKFSKLISTDARATYAKMQELIVSWDYDVDPHDPDALAKLPLQEGAKIIETIKGSLNTLLEENTVEVKVDLVSAKWTALDMGNFYETLSEFNYPAIHKILHEVCTIEGVDKIKPLSLLDGVAMVEAVKKRHNDIMAGKF